VFALKYPLFLGIGRILLGIFAFRAWSRFFTGSGPGHPEKASAREKGQAGAPGSSRGGPGKETSSGRRTR